MFEEANKKELVTVARSLGHDAHEELAKERLISLLENDEHLEEWERNPVDSIRDKLMSFLLERWRQVSPQLTCPAASGDPYSCYECVDAQVLVCLAMNAEHKDKILATKAVQKRRLPMTMTVRAEAKTPEEYIKMAGETPLDEKVLAAIPPIHLRGMMSAIGAYTPQFILLEVPKKVSYASQALKLFRAKGKEFFTDSVRTAIVDASKEGRVLPEVADSTPSVPTAPAQAPAAPAAPAAPTAASVASAPTAAQKSLRKPKMAVEAPAAAEAPPVPQATTPAPAPASGAAQQILAIVSEMAKKLEDLGATQIAMLNQQNEIAKAINSMAVAVRETSKMADDTARTVQETIEVRETLSKLVAMQAMANAQLLGMEIAEVIDSAKSITSTVVESVKGKLVRRATQSTWMWNNQHLYNLCMLWRKKQTCSYRMVCLYKRLCLGLTGM